MGIRRLRAFVFDEAYAERIPAAASNDALARKAAAAKINAAAAF
jgi:hypothetical protein